MDRYLKDLYDKNQSIILAITGGGTEVIGSLLKYGGGSKCILEAIVPYSKEASIKLVGGKEPEHFCSRDHALDLAVVSWKRAKEYRADRPAMGVGSCARLGVDGERKGRVHEIWVAIQTDRETFTWHVEFTTLNDLSYRETEEEACAKLIYYAIGVASDINAEAAYRTLQAFLFSNEKIESCVQRGNDQAYGVFTGIRRFEIFPNPGHRLNSQSVIFPGSFNPLHDGHINMAAAVWKKLGRETVFEICINNTDKPSIDYMRLQERMSNIFTKLKDEPWFGGIMVTDRPTFLEKGRMLKAYGMTTFLVGSDTLTRINDPKYYPDRGWHVPYQEMYSTGMSFIVCERGYANHGQMGYNFGLTEYPIPIISIPESFYKDSGISSTQLRKQQNVY